MKRNYGTGGITWLEKGKAKIRIRTRPDPITGKCRQVSRTVYGNRDDAEIALLKLKLEYASEPVSKPDVTLEALVDLYLDSPKKNGEERSPYARHKERRRFERHVRPAFAGRQADSVSPQELTLFYDQLLKVPLSPATIKLVNALIGAAYERGLRRGLVSSNPTKLAERPSVTARKPTAPRIDTVLAHLDLLYEEDPELALLVLLASGLALRRSELLALRWEHVDLIDGSINICEGITNTPTVGQQTTGTKTGRLGWTIFQIGEHLMDELTKQHERLEKAAANLGVEIKPGSYVFSPAPLHQKAWYPDSVTKRVKRHMRAHPELPSFTLKDLRAFAATEVALSGAPRAMASAILRHQSIQTTEKYYVAVRDGQAREAALDLQRRLDERG